MKRLFATLATLGIALLVSAALLEGGVLLTKGPQARFPRRVVGAPFGVRINEPGARYWHTSPDVHVEFRINAQGMRDDRDFAYAKPAGVRRIVSLGDSFTAGYEVSGEETFSSVLERALRADGRRVEVLNAGVSGYSTAEEALYLERELFRYEPDLVLVSFYSNDLVDNARAGLFRLDGDQLVQIADSYVPGGRFGNLLNTNPLFSFLSEHSSAFALLKEAATTAAKQSVVAENLGHVASAEGAMAGDNPFAREQRRLTAAIFERIYADVREKGIPLLIQSIPTPVYPDGPGGARIQLLDLFPMAEFPVDRPGLAFLSAKTVLDPLVGKQLLYHLRSHGHWTPLAHRLDGQALAKLVEEQSLLPR